MNPTLRLFFVVALLWALELCLLPSIRLVRVLLFPLLLLLIFLGFQLSSVRFLWFYGMLIGLLRDLATGAFFGGFICTFGLVGWLLGAVRHLFEREDPLIQGVWAGILTGVSCFVYGLFLIFADPAVGWNRWSWGVIPAAMVLNGGCAVWGFPRLQRFLRMTGR